MGVVNKKTVVNEFIDVPSACRIICNGNSKNERIDIGCHSPGHAEFGHYIPVGKLVVNNDRIPCTGITGRSEQLVHIGLVHYAAARFVPDPEIRTLASIDHLYDMIGSGGHGG